MLKTEGKSTDLEFPPLAVLPLHGNVGFDLAESIKVKLPDEGAELVVCTDTRSGAQDKQSVGLLLRQYFGFFPNKNAALQAQQKNISACQVALYGNAYAYNTEGASYTKRILLRA